MSPRKVQRFGENMIPRLDNFLWEGFGLQVRRWYGRGGGTFRLEPWDCLEQDKRVRVPSENTPYKNTTI